MPRETGESSDSSRRRFLKATGAATLTSAVAGCAGGGTDTSTSGGGTGTDDGDISHDSYPYGINKTSIGKAKNVMENAGYGPDNKFELDWLQYKSPAWKEMAKTIQSRLEAAHIKMNISEAGFGSLLKKTKKGDMGAYTLGWIADYPGPKNFVQLVDPPNTIYGEDNPDANGARLFWTEDAKASKKTRKFMHDQFKRIQDNPEPTDEATNIRNDAAVKMEEGMWEEAVLLPIRHSLTEYFWYDKVDYNPPGAMGNSRAKAHKTVSNIEGDNTLNYTSTTVNTLDPAAGDGTASGDKMMDLYDALVNYRNGTVEVENLLAKGYEVNDDFTTYTFNLKEGVQFHGDFGEVTASDVVYSIKRLMLSQNSTNGKFPKSVMGIEHETDGDGNVKPDSIGVEAVDDYTVEISIDQPFSYSLEVLAYGAFSIVPEGIVGDIPGYDGEMGYEEFSTSNPVGAGPFTLDKWETGNGGELQMSRFEDYHGSTPSFDTIHHLISTSTQARYKYFLNGNSDVDGIPTAQYDPDKVSIESTDGPVKTGTYGPMDNDETVNYAQVPEMGTYWIAFNLQKVPKPVRKAMAYVVNREEFVNKIFKGRTKPAYHIMPPQVYPGGQQAYNKHYKK